MKTVAIWKRAWLPPSETFVRNQMDSLMRWQSVAFGVRRIDSVLARDEDVILFGEGLLEKVALAAFRLRGHSPRVTKFLKDHDVQVVHAHFGSEAVSIWRQCRKVDIPLVVTLHGHDITAGPATPGFAGWRYRRRLRSMFGYATQIIAVSKFIRERALAYGAADDKTVVRYIGIPIAAPCSSEASAPHQSKWDLAFVGRLTHKKGVQDLLAALSLLEKRGRPSPSLAIVGSGPLEEELRAMAQTAALRVDFLGHLSPGEVRNVLEASRVFVAPSRTAADGDAEGFGLVFLEAAAAGLPVVAYAHGGVVEAVAHGLTGLLCPEGDVASLAEAVASLIDDPTRATTMGLAGRERMRLEFDVHNRTRELEQVYDLAAARRRS